MVRKDEIREKILGLGADVCGFGGMERFIEAPVDFRPTDLYPDCKSVIAVGIALPKGLLRVEPRLLYGHFNADVVHKVDRQYKRSKSSNIVSVIADNTLNFNQFM